MKTLNIIVVIIAVMMQPIGAFYRLPVLYNHCVVNCVVKGRLWSTCGLLSPRVLRLGRRDLGVGQV